MFKKILVPIDGSKNSMHALEKAVQIAKKFDGKITLIHVYSVAWLISKPRQLTMLSKLIEATREDGNKILADGEKREGIQVERLLREGHTVDKILKTCREGEFDLIVIGARGLSTTKEILLGSVSHGVTRHAGCPVLVVK